MGRELGTGEFFWVLCEQSWKCCKCESACPKWRYLLISHTLAAFHGYCSL